MAEEKKAAATATRDTILVSIPEGPEKAKAKLLADAAISGASVTKMSAEVTANSADDACDQWFFKANLASGSGACVASAAASAARRRRRLMSRFIRRLAQVSLF